MGDAHGLPPIPDDDDARTAVAGFLLAEGTAPAATGVRGCVRGWRPGACPPGVTVCPTTETSDAGPAIPNAATAATAEVFGRAANGRLDAVTAVTSALLVFRVVEVVTVFGGTCATP
jgi:hypothetical protein